MQFTMNQTFSKASFFEEALFHSTETYVHPTAIIGDDVELDSNVKIGPFCILIGKVKIESGTRLYANITVGFPAQARSTRDNFGFIHIKKNCEIREFVTIHASKYPDGKTEIGNNCYVMNYSHISHDVVLEDNVTLTNNVNLGGHTYIEKNANIMANCATHQFCRIGQFSALAPFSAIRQDLPPFSLFSGLPAAFAGLNVIGLKRAGLISSNLDALKRITKLFFQEKQPLENITALAEQEGWGTDPYVQQFISFIVSSTRGVSRRVLAEESKGIE
jgi:UDP-N-acetylglucosamine acyltransferase